MKTVLFSLILSGPIISQANKQEFKLKDTECRTMGAAIGEVKLQANEGSKSERVCSVSNDKLICRFDEEAEENKVLLNIQGMILARSESGNVTYIIDMDSKTFSVAQSNFIPERSLHISKHCVGKIRVK